MSPLLALPLALAIGAAPAPPAPAAPGCEDAPAPLAGWCAALAARPRLPMPTLADQEALRTVYARPELRRARADTAGFRRLVADLWARFMGLLGSAEAERYASVGRAVFIAAGLAALLAALAAVRGRRAAARAAPAGVEPELARIPAPDRSAELAQEALARGDLPGAVRHAFLSALAALEAAGRLPRDRTLTNRELGRRLDPDGGALGEDFRALGRAFDGAIYGGARVSDADARTSLDRARRIRAATGDAA